MIGLWIAWRISALVPTLIDTWEKRSTGIEARLQASMVAYTERMDAQLELADKQHKACKEEQDRLATRVAQQDTTIATQNETIAKQSATIVNLTDQVNALKTSNMQQQIAIAESGPHSPEMHKALGVLKKVHYDG
jgi:uncharacterized coiled-coil protein SlyX